MPDSTIPPRPRGRSSHPAPAKSSAPPPRRKSGRVLRPPPPLALQPETSEALYSRITAQNGAEPLHGTSKAKRLCSLCNDLEVATITKAAPGVTAGICLDVAALALRIFEQGD